MPERFWTEQRIVDAMRRWHGAYGHPPSAREWNPYRLRREGADDLAARLSRAYPRTQTVLDVFGTWNAAIEAAGYRAIRPGQTRRWV